MKPRIKNLFLLPVLIAGLGLILANRVTAQTFTTLYSFAAGSGYYPNLTNSDGARPWAGVIISGNTLYGTTEYGCSSGNGTVFAVNTDGTGFTNLHSFTASSTNSSGAYTNSDGTKPRAELILSGNSLYGTAGGGGSGGHGTLFVVNTNGTGFTNLHSFTYSDGSWPSAPLILSGNTLYGTTYGGGSSGKGTVFAVSTDGTDFTNLHNFAAVSTNSSGVYTNSDGTHPYGSLVLSGNTLYGPAADGGSSGNGTVFAVNTDGTGFTNLHNFTPPYTSFTGTNSDGAQPAALIVSDNALYGTAMYGGSSGRGTVFKVNTDGTGFTNLHSFTGLAFDTNGAGAVPNDLILSGSSLYGTTANGGHSGRGTVFKVNADGTAYTTLYKFTLGDPYLFSTNSDGAVPSGLILSGNTLYGTAVVGGSSGNGTVFSLSLPVPPQLSIIPSGDNVILTWPTNAAGFDYSGFTLQSTTNLGSSAVWITNSPPPVVVNGRNTVTNPISGTQQFYRLSQ